MPEPITTAARNALPSSSASSRRHNATWLIAFLIDRCRCSRLQLARCANASQDRSMSIQAGRKGLGLIPADGSAVVAAESCAIPLVREPLGESAAAGLLSVPAG